ncbi:MAG: hypothetical protein M3Y12_04940 [Bacteroidota bacterium]|nr:hypothetical protein [Bacteroidota bacterium]
MAQPKYAARFENFFLNLRLNRDQFADMAAFTLQALHQGGSTFKAVADTLDTALAGYRSTHSGQLSGEARGTVITLAQALNDFKAYVKKVERKFVIPNYEEKTADFVAIFPQGRGGLAKASQAKVEDAFVAFLDSLDARPTVFPSPLRKEGRETILPHLADALQRADGAATTTETQRIDLHDGREATCRALFRAYATLLLEYADQPRRAAAYFDLSKARISKSGAKTPKESKAGE